MRALLNLVCGSTIVASAWLGTMFVVLHRPGFERGLLMASLFGLQSLLVLAVTNGWLTGLGWRLLALAGATGLIWTGARAVATNLSSSHFEGYAFILGILLIAQALLTILATIVKSAPIRQLT